MSTYMMRMAFALFMITAALGQAFAQAGATTMQEADTLFQARKWADAARLYEAVTKAEAANGRAWYRLGVSLHNLSRYAQAVDAYQKALAINNKNLLAMYNLASSYARLNDKEKAFEWLNKAFNAGYPHLYP